MAGHNHIVRQRLAQKAKAATKRMALLRRQAEKVKKDRAEFIEAVEELMRQAGEVRGRV
jgi:hypothetical protein